MRVDVVETIPKTTGEADTNAADGLAAKNFVAALESDNSLFTLLEPLYGRAGEDGTNVRSFFGDVSLAFKQPDLGKQRSLHFLVVEKLIELLKEAGSKETLEAKLCLLAGSRENPNSRESTLCIRLTAKGDSAEQAELRWGLGLTHLQQALLFTSRHLRQHLTQSKE
jgi:hypothetical protein